MADPSAFLWRRRTENHARPTHGLEVGTAVTVEVTEPVIAVIAPTCEGGSRGNGVLRSEDKPVGAAEPSLADSGLVGSLARGDRHAAAPALRPGICPGRHQFSVSWPRIWPQNTVKTIRTSATG